MALTFILQKTAQKPLLMRSWTPYPDTLEHSFARGRRLIWPAKERARIIYSEAVD
jgi:hypothetical protein